MNTHLQSIFDLIKESDTIPSERKEALFKSLKQVDRELEIVNFKLSRTEKVKRTTAILLEETIAELEQKRKMVEQAKLDLEKSLEDLKTTQKQLIHSEKMASLGELTAGIAHEIQNPLNFVNNFSDVSSEMLDEAIQEIDSASDSHLTKEAVDEVKDLLTDIKLNLEKITHHGQRASSIVKGMLSHSRATSTQKELTDINALCDEYLRLSYHGLRAKDRSFNCDFETCFDPDIPQINLVPQEIGRVILNIINNGFYAIDQRRRLEKPGFVPLLKLSTSLKKNSKTDNVVISITDNGGGIPKDILDKIFQPFFTTKPTGSGTGLGLSLSYDIVTKGHGGSLDVKSVQGEGTTFVISIPMHNQGTS